MDLPFMFLSTASGRFAGDLRTVFVGARLIDSSVCLCCDTALVAE